MTLLQGRKEGFGMEQAFVSEAEHALRVIEKFAQYENSDNRAHQKKGLRAKLSQALIEAGINQRLIALIMSNLLQILQFEKDRPDPLSYSRKSNGRKSKTKFYFVPQFRIDGRILSPDEWRKKFIQYFLTCMDEGAMDI